MDISYDHIITRTQNIFNKTPFKLYNGIYILCVAIIGIVKQNKLQMVCCVIDLYETVNICIKKNKVSFCSMINKLSLINVVKKLMPWLKRQ